MDISEYEALKENKSLLEAALKREKEQNSKIETLQQEKIDVMKQNEKSVTIVERVDTTEIALIKRGTEDILRRLRTYFDKGNIGGYYSSLRGDIDSITEVFFEKTEARSFPTEKSVTYKGLDEVKEELKKLVEEEVDFDRESLEKTISSLRNRLEIGDDRIQELQSKVTDLKLDLEAQQKDNELLSQENLEQEELIEALTEDLNWNKKLLEDIKKVKKGFFGRLFS